MHSLNEIRANESSLPLEGALESLSIFVVCHFGGIASFPS